MSILKERRLEDIGFYTLSNERAKNSSVNSPLYRTELILNESCNFRCVYCRGLREDCSGSVPLTEALSTIDLWINEGLKNVRFSGGEPTLYKGLVSLVKRCKEGGVQRIAISTNGSASIELYRELFDAGMNDFSISLDGCCASIGDAMAGGIKGIWNTVIDNIIEISKFSYVTVGMVFTEDNVGQCIESVLFASSLGVSDIRVIPSAQYNKALEMLSDLPEDILYKYPILKYRIENLKEERHVRGIDVNDSHKCWLAIDDMAVAGGRNGLKHFPCIIYLREGGDPIANVGPDMRKQRESWIRNHDTHCDPICRKNCLDVCVDYNNKAQIYK